MDVQTIIQFAFCKYCGIEAAYKASVRNEIQAYESMKKAHEYGTTDEKRLSRSRFDECVELKSFNTLRINLPIVCPTIDGECPIGCIGPTGLCLECFDKKMSAQDIRTCGRKICKDGFIPSNHIVEINYHKKIHYYSAFRALLQTVYPDANLLLCAMVQIVKNFNSMEQPHRFQDFIVELVHLCILIGKTTEYITVSYTDSNHVRYSHGLVVLNDLYEQYKSKCIEYGADPYNNSIIDRAKYVLNNTDKIEYEIRLHKEVIEYMIPNESEIQEYLVRRLIAYERRRYLLMLHCEKK